MTLCLRAFTGGNGPGGLEWGLMEVPLRSFDAVYVHFHGKDIAIPRGLIDRVRPHEIGAGLFSAVFGDEWYALYEAELERRRSTP